MRCPLGVTRLYNSISGYALKASRKPCSRSSNICVPGRLRMATLPLPPIASATCCADEPSSCWEEPMKAMRFEDGESPQMVYNRNTSIDGFVIPVVGPDPRQTLRYRQVFLAIAWSRAAASAFRVNFCGTNVLSLYTNASPAHFHPYLWR